MSNMETAIYMLALGLFVLVFAMLSNFDDDDFAPKYRKGIDKKPHPWYGATARTLVSATTAYIIFSLFYTITKYVLI